MLSNGTSGWGDPLKRARLLTAGRASRVRSYISLCPLRPGGVASEQQTSRTAKAREGLGGLLAST